MNPLPQNPSDVKKKYALRKIELVPSTQSKAAKPESDHPEFELK